MKLDSGRLVNNYNEVVDWLKAQGADNNFVMLFNNDSTRELYVWLYPDNILAYKMNLYIPFAYPNRKIIPSYI